MPVYKWPLMKDTLTFVDRIKLAKFILTSDRFTQGKKVEEFEGEWSQWLGTKHSLYVTSGSTANFLLLDAVRELFFNNEKKVKVLLPACTWVTNINPVIQLGMEPVFCDVNLYNYSFDVENMIQISKDHEIDIVFVTHLLGFAANIAVIRKIFPNAIILEDVCESHGAKGTKGAKAGTLGTGSTFSFYYGHHMSTIEGGMISTNNTDLYDLMKMKRSHGMSRASIHADFYNVQYPDIDSQFLFVTSGYNFRNTELGAVLGLSQLPKLNNFIERRRENFFLYMDITKECNLFHRPLNDQGNSSFCFPFIAKDIETKKKLIKIFNEESIEYRPVVGGNLLRHPYMKNYSISSKSKPYNADIIHENGVYIGNNQFVGDRELATLEKIIGSIS
jgi:CDP-4-dehydro-6-deoxyglucose reductase, E1